MSAEVFVAALWGAVLVYWLWTRRPSTADTVGLFHYKLEVLERATPTRVAPANRLVPPAPAEPQPRYQPEAPVLPPQVAVAAAVHKRTELRRRRRDVLGMLVGAAFVTLFAAALSGSAVALGFQVSTDLALAGYLYLLYTAMRNRAAAGFYRGAPPPLAYEARPYFPPRTSAQLPLTFEGRHFAHFEAPSSGLRSPGKVPDAALTTGPMVAIALPPPAPSAPPARSAVHVGAGHGRALYGDFDSYASLA